MNPTRLRPVLASPFRLLGPNPSLLAELTNAKDGSAHECVDHHVFQSADGRWHLWGCIRRTLIGRLLYHWEGSGLDDLPWTPTGEYFRADLLAGESLADWQGEEWLQSPFVVPWQGQYFMFYGGHGSGGDQLGRPVLPDDPRLACQMCLMTSPDGRHWQRYQGPGGFSRVFVGPGEVRDPCLIRIGDVWHCYYAGYENEDPEQAGMYVRTSRDLYHWSDWRLVHRAHQIGRGRWSHECPQVVVRGGLYYLFRTEDYETARTHVFCSADPLDFGIDAGADDKYLGLISLAAPEIIVDAQGREYVTSNHDLFAGTQICRLAWVPA